MGCRIILRTHPPTMRSSIYRYMHPQVKMSSRFGELMRSGPKFSGAMGMGACYIESLRPPPSWPWAHGFFETHGIEDTACGIPPCRRLRSSVARMAEDGWPLKPKYVAAVSLSIWRPESLCMGGSPARPVAAGSSRYEFLGSMYGVAAAQADITSTTGGNGAGPTGTKSKGSPGA